MSITLTFTGNQSTLRNEYFPPLELDGKYECSLIDFSTYNSIPNIDESNSLIHIGKEIIVIPTGSYEIDDIGVFVKNKLLIKNPEIAFSLKANNNTLQTEIKCSETIYFNKDRSIGRLLGFSKQELNKNIIHYSDLPVNIIKVNEIFIECDIITASYVNNKLGHTLHHFSPAVAPGYKIVEIPSNLIYLPVNVKQISTVTLKIVDQDNNLINLRGEEITIRIHLRKIIK